MRNLRFTISYDGSSYSGFQVQPKSDTIQYRLEQAVFLLTGETVKVISSGRTDAGVHAKAQVINFTTSSKIPVERWCLALNARLPKDIVAHTAEEVLPTFHSRKAAKRKTYCYTIRSARFPDVFHRNFEYHHPTHLNVEAMREALPCLLGEHDFTSFCTVRTDKEIKVRTLYQVRMETETDDLLATGKVDRIRLIITGNGFLYNMVRIIVGTLIQIGEGKRPSSDMLRVLEARDRSQAGPTAEAMGLTLWKVEY
ncbi:tRNA pseudouridine(38,39,40) synthase TruA [Paenibacillus pectinilyticus]|uniref:tRNA pseudouridine synthase A n=1 Tax=Paenibacillus pectinilyticus TaxID=512399 RepID=A0A1C0ZS52_9BACL|nr:tRNA pseudouridine(38-40) synthase TruA [Paenibacillus pectinilyticus]OCT10891.1 tRNA pseudouridine(38,39,40) synthase TruA [Paenibacillus pectinilyticus]